MKSIQFDNTNVYIQYLMSYEDYCMSEYENAFLDFDDNYFEPRYIFHFSAASLWCDKEYKVSEFIGWVIIV